MSTFSNEVQASIVWAASMVHSGESVVNKFGRVPAVAGQLGEFSNLKLALGGSSFIATRESPSNKHLFDLHAQIAAG